MPDKENGRVLRGFQPPPATIFKEKFVKVLIIINKNSFVMPNYVMTSRMYRQLHEYEDMADFLVRFPRKGKGPCILCLYPIHRSKMKTHLWIKHRVDYNILIYKRWEPGRPAPCIGRTLAYRDSVWHVLGLVTEKNQGPPSDEFHHNAGQYQKGTMKPVFHGLIAARNQDKDDNRDTCELLETAAMATMDTDMRLRLHSAKKPGLCPFDAAIGAYLDTPMKLKMEVVDQMTPDHQSDNSDTPITHKKIETA